LIDNVYAANITKAMATMLLLYLETHVCCCVVRAQILHLSYYADKWFEMQDECKYWNWYCIFGILPHPNV